MSSNELEVAIPPAPQDSITETEVAETTGASGGNPADTLRTIVNQTESLEENFDDDSQSDAEANIILIAHPANQRLGTRFRLAQGNQINIGRSPDGAICLQEVPSVSRFHATVRYDRGDITIEDHESTNGTYINDRRVISRSILRSGDRFQVGSVHFKFLHELDIESAYHDAIYQLAIHDGITGIFNRSRFDEEIEREFSRARRHKRPLGLMLFDIDNFKDVNDTYGHLFGDFVLQDIANLVIKLLRQEQIFARVGGDEFSIICPETNAPGTTTLAERIANKIGAHPLSHQGVSLKVSCSFGVSGITEDDLNSNELYARADRAMYQSKNSGRNQVSTL